MFMKKRKNKSFLYMTWLNGNMFARHLFLVFLVSKCCNFLWNNKWTSCVSSASWSLFLFQDDKKKKETDVSLLFSWTDSTTWEFMHEGCLLQKRTFLYCLFSLFKKQRHFSWCHFLSERSFIIRKLLDHSYSLRVRTPCIMEKVEFIDQVFVVNKNKNATFVFCQLD